MAKIENKGISAERVETITLNVNGAELRLTIEDLCDLHEVIDKIMEERDITSRRQSPPSGIPYLPRVPEQPLEVDPYAEGPPWRQKPRYPSGSPFGLRETWNDCHLHDGHQTQCLDLSFAQAEARPTDDD